MRLNTPPPQFPFSFHVMVRNIIYNQRYLKSGEYLVEKKFKRKDALNTYDKNRCRHPRDAVLCNSRKGTWVRSHTELPYPILTVYHLRFVLDPALAL